MLGWFAGRQVKRDKSYRSLHREPTGDCSRNRKRDACLPAAQRYDRARGPRDLGARRRTCSSCRTIPPSGGSLARFPIYAEAGRVGAPSNPTPFSSTASSTGGLRDGESIEPVVPTTGALNRTPNQKNPPSEGAMADVKLACGSQAWRMDSYSGSIDDASCCFPITRSTTAKARVFAGGHADRLGDKVNLCLRQRDV